MRELPIIKSIKSIYAKASVLCVSILSLFVFETAIADDVFFDKAQLNLNGEAYLLEIARSAKQRKHGLMFRNHLAKRQGMLFVYPRSGDHRIWMKNTLVPLTVVWLDKNEKVIGIKKLLPCTADPCRSYGVPIPSRYVLELNSAGHSLKPGVKIEGLIRILQKDNE